MVESIHRYAETGGRIRSRWIHCIRSIGATEPYIFEVYLEIESCTLVGAREAAGGDVEGCLVRNPCGSCITLRFSPSTPAMVSGDRLRRLRLWFVLSMLQLGPWEESAWHIAIRKTSMCRCTIIVVAGEKKARKILSR